MKKLIIASILITTLSACSVNKQALGLGRQNPDEFVVLQRQPLSMPPEYNLAPPEPGKEPLKAINPEKEAKLTVLGTSDEDSNYISNEDKEFLNQLGTDKYAPNIRNILEKETVNDPANDKRLINDVMFWKEKDNSVVIDNLEESKRLKENKEQGLPIDSGEVPIFNPSN